MKKTLKKICSSFLVVAMMLTLLSGIALAADGNYLKITAEKTDDTTVVLTVKLVRGITDLGSLNVKFEAPNGFVYQSLTAEKLSAGGNLSASATPGWFYQNSPLSLNVDDVLYVVTYKTASAIADGNYDFSVEVTDAAKSDFSDHDIIRDKATCTLSVSTPVAEGYTVNMTASDSEVDTNSTVDINLDVTNSDTSVTTFNAVDMTLTYDSTLFTFVSDGSTLNNFDVDTSTLGTLGIKGYGANVNMGDGNEFVLKFTAGSTASEGSFDLTAKVAQAETANTDIEAATVTGTPQSVTVKAPAVAKYTVTFNANGHGTAPEAITNVESGSTITAPTDPTADGYTFGGWYKEPECTNTWNFDSDTVTSNITLYAKWTENEAAVDTVTLNTNYLSGYTLIGITVKDADGKVPQYNDDTMYKVTNVGSKTTYKADTYYYVVSGNVTEETVKAAVSFAAGTDEAITKTGDANCTGVIDINDAQFIYNLYNTNTITVTYTPTVAQLLASDVNGDGVVGTADCAAAVAAIQ